MRLCLVICNLVFKPVLLFATKKNHLCTPYTISSKYVTLIENIKAVDT